MIHTLFGRPTARFARHRSEVPLADRARDRLAEQPDIIEMSDDLIERIAGVLTGHVSRVVDETPIRYLNVVHHARCPLCPWRGPDRLTQLLADADASLHLVERHRDLESRPPVDAS